MARGGVIVGGVVLLLAGGVVGVVRTSDRDATTRDGLNGPVGIPLNSPSNEKITICKPNQNVLPTSFDCGDRIIVGVRRVPGGVRFVRPITGTLTDTAEPGKKVTVMEDQFCTVTGENKKNPGHTEGTPTVRKECS